MLIGGLELNMSRRTVVKAGANVVGGCGSIWIVPGDLTFEEIKLVEKGNFALLQLGRLEDQFIEIS